MAIKFKINDIELYLAAAEQPDVATAMPWIAMP